eukprot:Tbor_TRINITY_DN5027_c0_g1::TRINITY_DN5027_c0_g1_i1::g.14032::m.14032
MWECAECCNENDADMKSCEACGHTPTHNSDDRCDTSKILIAKVLSFEEIHQKTSGSKPLKKLLLSLKDTSETDDNDTLTVVTNAPNIKTGMLTVVALPGAVVNINGEDITVKPTSVGGVVSKGMLCDSGMLGWSGGAAGYAVVIPEGKYTAGSVPPEARPRGD